MNKLYFLTKRIWPGFAVATLVSLFILPFAAISQVRVDFEQRTSQYTPTKKIYNIKGDFTMIGNTNLTLQNYSDEGNNSSTMSYVDVDGDGTTFNSSSATLTFSGENGALEECSDIIYAGLYWTGRAHDGNQCKYLFGNQIGRNRKYDDSGSNKFQCSGI